jgi:hypothetical protein
MTSFFRAFLKLQFIASRNRPAENGIGLHCLSYEKSILARASTRSVRLAHMHDAFSEELFFASTQQKWLRRRSVGLSDLGACASHGHGEAGICLVEAKAFCRLLGAKSRTMFLRKVSRLGKKKVCHLSIHSGYARTLEVTVNLRLRLHSM